MHNSDLKSQNIQPPVSNPPYSLDQTLIDMQSLSDSGFSGNIVPHIWYQVITRDSGKADLPAILILSEIVYWYRPVVIIDEATGRVIGLKRKFRADMLQRSIPSLAEQFGVTRRAVAEALKRLHEAGLIYRELRTVDTPHGKLPNVLFLAPNVAKLMEMQRNVSVVQETDDCEQNDMVKLPTRDRTVRNDVRENHDNQQVTAHVPYGPENGGIPPQKRGDGHAEIAGRYGEKCMTYTEITTQTSTEISQRAAAAGKGPDETAVADSPPLSAAAAFSSKNENTIGEQLSTEQHRAIDTALKNRLPGLSDAQRQQLAADFRRVMVNPKAYTAAGRDFGHKLNILLKCAAEGRWTSPVPPDDGMAQKPASVIDEQRAVLLDDITRCRSDIAHFSRTLERTPDNSGARTALNNSRERLAGLEQALAAMDTQEQNA